MISAFKFSISLSETQFPQVPRCVAWFHRVLFAANLTVAQLPEVKLLVNVVAESPIVVLPETDAEF